MSETKNKGGRPRKHPAGPRTNLTVRLPTSLRDRLHAAAQTDGRSLAEMIERILEAHLTAADTRAIIREEIRAALAQSDVVRVESFVSRVKCEKLFVEAWNAATGRTFNVPDA